MRHNRRVDAILARLSALLFLLCELAGGDRLPGAEKKKQKKNRGHHLGIAVAYELCMVLKS